MGLPSEWQGINCLNCHVLPPSGEPEVGDGTPAQALGIPRDVLATMPNVHALSEFLSGNVVHAVQSGLEI